MSTDEIILVTHADTDNGYILARDLLAAGYRVAVTAHHPASLSRILLGHKADRVTAIAADIHDSAQRAAVLRRACAKFGAPVTRIIDGRDAAGTDSVPLQIAS